jgi:hypothetical protein
MDAMGVARNVVLEPKLLPGGGACEMAVARALTIKADTIEGVEQWPYRAVAAGLEVRGTQGRGCEGVWSRVALSRSRRIPSRAWSSGRTVRRRRGWR